MSEPSNLASVAPNVGQTPEELVPYPKPARPSLPPPSAELARQVANKASSGRMSVAAAFTDKVPPWSRATIADGGAVSGELSPQRFWAIRFAGAGTVGRLTVQRGCAK